MSSQRDLRSTRRRVISSSALVALFAGLQAWAAPVAAAAPADVGAADLSVSVAHAPSAPFTGDLLTFTITATNAGPGPASGVVAGLSLAYPFRYAPSPTPTGSACNVAQETSAVLCSLGTIPAGKAASVQVVVTPLAAGVFPVPAAVASDTPDPDAADRSSSDTVLVQQGPTQIERAVAGIYDLVLDRAPTARENRYWSDAWMGSLWERRHRVPLAIISGSESRRRRVAEAYPRLLGRPASAGDVATWSARLAAGLTFERFEAVLVRRARGPELADWTRRIGGGATVGQLAVSLASSTEGRDRVMARRFQDAIGRPPSNFDRFFWFSALNEGSTADIEWAKLLVSDNYLSRFAPTYPGYLVID